MTVRSFFRVIVIVLFFVFLFLMILILKSSIRQNLDKITSSKFSSTCTQNSHVGQSGLPLPRFVSLKSEKVNVRVGPDQKKYAISWSFHCRGLPVEIIQEYDNWRRIRDNDGDKGWINKALLSSKRTAMITPWQKNKVRLQKIYKKPAETSNLVARVEPGVIVNINKCTGKWCELETKKKRGWIKQKYLWGVYPDEKIL